MFKNDPIFSESAVELKDDFELLNVLMTDMRKQPNLYIGSQYLKAFFGNAISDYRSLRKSDHLGFSKNDELEIFQ